MAWGPVWVYGWWRATTFFECLDPVFFRVCLVDVLRGSRVGKRVSFRWDWLPLRRNIDMNSRVYVGMATAVAGLCASLRGFYEWKSRWAFKHMHTYLHDRERAIEQISSEPYFFISLCKRQRKKNTATRYSHAHIKSPVLCTMQRFCSSERREITWILQVPSHIFAPQLN